nr:MAG TPA: hypothetical protein [Caudoviricetes sp.]
MTKHNYCVIINLSARTDSLFFFSEKGRNSLLPPSYTSVANRKTRSALTRLLAGSTPATRAKVKLNIVYTSL